MRRNNVATHLYFVTFTRLMRIMKNTTLSVLVESIGAALHRVVVEPC